MATITAAPRTHVSSSTVREDPKPEWPYKDEYAVIRPVRIQTEIGERAAVSCYLQMKKDGLEEWTFPGMERPDLATFLECCKNGFVLGFDAEEKNTIGFGSLVTLEYPSQKLAPGEPAKHGKASGMYCFFRKWHRSDVIRHAARLTLRFWFEQYNLRLIMGSALQRNMAARAFGRRLGFVESGIVPSFFWKEGKAEAAAILSLERDRFMEVH